MGEGKQAERSHINYLYKLQPWKLIFSVEEKTLLQHLQQSKGTLQHQQGHRQKRDHAKHRTWVQRRAAGICCHPFARQCISFPSSCFGRRCLPCGGVAALQVFAVESTEQPQSCTGSPHGCGHCPLLWHCLLSVSGFLRNRKSFQTPTLP